MQIRTVQILDSPKSRRLPEWLRWAARLQTAREEGVEFEATMAGSRP